MANQPPFKVPFVIKNANRYRWLERKIPDISDGDESKWPSLNSGYRTATKEFYLCHLGQQWATKDGLDEIDVHYYIDKLPSGYAMFETVQPGGRQVYKRLFGHPSGRFYDSAIKFEPHFLWLMSEMEGDCECTLCSKKPFVTRPRKLQAGSVQLPVLRQRRSQVDDEASLSEASSSSNSAAILRRGPRMRSDLERSFAVDEEGNEDIYKDCIRRLAADRQNDGITRISLEEKGSIDWRAERACLPQYLTQVEQQHSLIPRVGELVLWCADWPQDQYLMLDLDTSEYKLYSFDEKSFCGFPQWRAGIVAAGPSNLAKHESLDFSDILDVNEKTVNLSVVGFRVETMPDPNNGLDKALSKQYKYVPLRNIRPLTQWQMLLHGSDVSQQHNSIAHALSCMTTVSLLEKWLFTGNWPNGVIFCRGIYLGSELIIAGDAVRLVNAAGEESGNQASCTDVLVVSSIRYNLVAMSEEHASNTTAALSSRTYITLVGQAYTIDPRRAHGSVSGQRGPLQLQKVKEIFRGVGANEYGPWYPLHAPSQKLEVSHERVFGRLYEADAVRLWTGQRQSTQRISGSKPQLGFDFEGIMVGREYANATDERLPATADATRKNWYVADTRAQALALSSLNDMDLGQYHNVRSPETLRYWRDALKVVDGHDVGAVSTPGVETDSWSDMKKRRRGRPPGSKVVNGRLVLPGQMPQQKDVSRIREELKSSSQMAVAALISDSEDYESHPTNGSESESDGGSFRG